MKGSPPTFFIMVEHTAEQIEEFREATCAEGDDVVQTPRRSSVQNSVAGKVLDRANTAMVGQLTKSKTGSWLLEQAEDLGEQAEAILKERRKRRSILRKRERREIKLMEEVTKEVTGESNGAEKE